MKARIRAPTGTIQSISGANKQGNYHLQALSAHHLSYFVLEPGFIVS